MTAIRRIQFCAEAPQGAALRRIFRQPRPAVAVEEEMSPADLPPPGVWPEPTGQLWVVLAQPGETLDFLHDPAAWLAPPDQPEAPLPVAVERQGMMLRWRPGRAVLQAPPDQMATALAALTEFAFYEGELRALERTVEDREPEAQRDVELAYRVRHRHRDQWPRLGDLLEGCARDRLTFARLQPRLARGSKSLPPAARQLVTKLLRQAAAPARSKALDIRLEALEDLYEGAVDRIADYRWYRNGHSLETTIILLLVLEAILMAVEVSLSYRT
jgi:hypothetical protein